MEIVSTLSVSGVASRPTEGPKALPKVCMVRSPWAGRVGRPMRAAPDRISEKVEVSIKEAEETCAEDPASGECAAAWDEVEELSAAASHAKDKAKGTNPLEEFCKDNPESDECRTYED